MSADNEESNKRKRTRTKNTSTEQYQIYIHFMENNYHFRSNTINPSLENYIGKKWVELKNLLNAAGDGPQLSSEEWKKRFIDWKYAVRSKYRKINEHRNKTGSGPQTENKLSKIEDLALSVWGKVVVTGSPFISSYDGINSVSIQSNDNDNDSTKSAPCHTESEPCSSQSDLNSSQHFKNTNTYVHLDIGDAKTEPVQVELDPTLQFCTPSVDLNNDFSSISSNISVNNLNTNLPIISDENSSNKNNIRKTASRAKQLSIVSENLLQSSQICAENSKELNSILKDFAKEYINCKKDKLKFKIAKYKFENSNFNFQRIISKKFLSKIVQ